MLLSRHSVGTYLETSSHSLVRNIWPQLSQLAEPFEHSPQILASEEKATTTTNSDMKLLTRKSDTKRVKRVTRVCIERVRRLGCERVTPFTQKTLQ